MTQMIPPETPDLLAKLSASALSLAAQTPWERVTLSDICADCDVPLVDCAKASVTKAHITARLDSVIDQSMLAAHSKVDRSQPVRDRLFDVVMGRFDAMEENRAAWASIFTAEKRDVMASLARRARRVVSAAWALEASGISTGNVRGAGRSVGLARIMRLAESAWLEDGPDLAKTMACLDQELRAAEAWVERIQSVGNLFGAKSVVEPTL